MTLKSDLKSLHNVQASNTLHKRLDAMVSGLPMHKRGFNSSLIIFRLTVVGLILILFALPTTGILFAAKGSSQGSPFFPLKKTLEEHHAPFFQNTPTVTVAPIATITPSSKNKELESNEKHKEEKEIKEERKENEKEVKGVSDSKEKKHKGDNEESKIEEDRDN